MLDLSSITAPWMVKIEARCAIKLSRTPKLWSLDSPGLYTDMHQQLTNTTGLNKHDETHLPCDCNRHSGLQIHQTPIRCPEKRLNTPVEIKIVEVWEGNLDEEAQTAYLKKAAWKDYILENSLLVLPLRKRKASRNDQRDFDMEQ